ncbi:MAG TPA: diguanylate cyclase, partial [Vicinamibacteria bacterium]|nr:diguanylate cyclase [Vicinamibacteria bacterium]
MALVILVAAASLALVWAWLADRSRRAAEARAAEASQASRAAEERQRTLLRELRLGVIVHGPKGEVLDANPAAVDLLGRPASEMARGESSLGRDVVREDGSPLAPGLRPVALVLATGEPVRGLVVGVTRPRSWDRVWLLADAYPHPTASGGGVVLTLLDITARKRLETEITEQTLRDPLTGCFNRRYIGEFARRADASALEHWGCIAIDLHGLKETNERLGHQAGDELLVRMGRFLMLQVRAGEAVVRLGGDEFLVLLTGVDGGTIGTVVNRISAEAVRQAPGSFALGWAVRESNEALERTVARAEAQLFAIPVPDRPESQRRAVEVAAA